MDWKRPDGEAFDPWIRVHLKLGGRMVGICHRSMEISGSVKEWKNWTGREFPGEGEYIIDQALVPVGISLKADRGTYVEPNVWMIHEV